MAMLLWTVYFDSPVSVRGRGDRGGGEEQGAGVMAAQCWPQREAMPT